MLPPHTTRKSYEDPDEPIRGTDTDAASSRLSAVSLGYLDDPFAALLHKPTAGSSSRKPPLINVGTHHRTWALDRLVDGFFEACEADGVEGQVVSLGAGSDTRFWRLMSRERTPALCHYIELDFPSTTSLKAQRIARSPRLSSLSSPASSPQRPQVLHGGQGLTSPRYTLLPLDLRTESLDAVLPYLDPTLPTLFLAECVLCYMTTEQGEEVIRWFGSRFERCMGVIYEMCGLDDQFGRVMRRNLASRNLSLPGAVYPTPATQAERFKSERLGDAVFEYAASRSLWSLREAIPEEELRRISRLEMLDEIEELKLVLEHYCIAWGNKGIREISM